MGDLVNSIRFSNYKNMSSDLREEKQSNRNEDYYYYEAIFLPKDKMIDAFRRFSKNYPMYEYIPDIFHVTTEFMPETTHKDLYGSFVNVHLTGYTYDRIYDVEKTMESYNEGFGVKVWTKDERLEDLFQKINKNWHITGSYSLAAKYTEMLDFSVAKPVDIILEGVFGFSDSEGRLII